MRFMKKVFSLAVSAFLMLGALTFAPVTARADISGAAGPVGLPTITIGTTSATPTVIGFGGKQWVVIGYDGVGNTTVADKLTLLLESASSMGTAQFITTFGPSYSGSKLQTAMDAAAAALSAGDGLLIAPTNLPGGAPPGDGDGMFGPDVSGALFWPLTVSEANQVNSTLRQFGADWWLRSAGGLSRAAYVFASGSVILYGSDTFAFLAVRPAFKLNLSSVLFTSDASAAGAAPVSLPAAFTPPATAIKFTAVDSAFSPGFAVTEPSVSGAPGGTVTLNYTGATTGNSHFIRVKLINSAGQIAYMAVPVSGMTAASGSFSLALTGMPPGTYTAYAWVEEGNGANLTNRGSTPDSFALTVNAPSSAKDITAFTIPNQVGGTVIADTSTTTGTIALTMPYGTNVTSLAPSITHTGTGIDYASGVARDFTGPVTYTVTAEDHSTKAYVVTVSVSPPAAVSAFVSNAVIGGRVGFLLGGGQTATVTLVGDTVSNALVNADASVWFTGLPIGITVTANAQAGGDTITLTFGGAPMEASSQAFVITVPGSVLTGGIDIPVTDNPDARFRIEGFIAPSSDWPEAGDSAYESFSELPKTGDGFPLGMLLAGLGILLVAIGWLALRLRKGRKHP